MPLTRAFLQQFSGDELVVPEEADGEWRTLETPDELVAFHSVAWQVPGNKGRPEQGEADFVLAHPEEGVLCIEAKGGTVDPVRQKAVPRYFTLNGRSGILGSDDFPPAAKRQAASDLTAAAQVGALSIPVRPPFPFEQVALAHDQVDADNRHRVLLAIRD